MPIADATDLYLAYARALVIPSAARQLVLLRRFDRSLLRIQLSLSGCRPALVELGRQLDRAGGGRGHDALIARWVDGVAGSTRDADAVTHRAEFFHRLRSLIADAERSDCEQALSQVRLRVELIETLIMCLRGDNSVAVDDQAGVAEFFSVAVRELRQLRRMTTLLVQANQRLILMAAQCYRHGPVQFMDLIQEGNLGLLRAIERFDPMQGARLSTYALWWIRRAMVYATVRHGQDMRPSVAQYWEARKIKRATLLLEEDLGRSASQREIAQAVGVTAGALHRALALQARPVELDDAEVIVDHALDGDRIAATDGMDPARRVRMDDMDRAIRRLLNHLPERQASILRMRFGIELKDGLTLEQIAQQQGVTRERIRQLEAQALNALRALDVAWDLRACLNES